jgi:hypothetical protein
VALDTLIQLYDGGKLLHAVQRGHYYDQTPYQPVARENHQTKIKDQL